MPILLHLALGVLGALAPVADADADADSSWTAVSTLAKPILEQTIQQHFDDIATCYQSGLDRNAQLAGTVIVRIAINANGAVSAVNVQESTLKDPPVETCICDALKKWKFPKPKGKGLLFATYPFVLKT